MVDIFCFGASLEESKRLDRLRDKLRPAPMRNATRCVRCGFCCERRSCVPTPDELKSIAQHLGLTAHELIDTYYAIDYSEKHDVYFVKPLGRNIMDLAGKFIPISRTFNEGACVFLKHSKKANLATCSIYKVRPETARLASCWIENDTTRDNHDQFAAWKPNELLMTFKIDGAALHIKDEQTDDEEV